ncbi:hypothetical protein GCM10009795_045660 [Nocardioides hankookensis]|uniref:NERD domain-containing protein n=1 Tax=Nocardioides hankookensis TaxID=443157 RepID=A0ABW1LSG8_9ACTN
MPDAETHEATARALLALSSEWTVLDDVVWPGRKPADIDQVVVGPGGVFVIVAGRTGRSAVAAARTAASVLERGAHLRRRTVHPVLCSTEPHPDGLGDDVLLCAPDTIVATLLAQPRALERDELHSASTTVTTQVRRHRRLRRSLTGGGSRRDRSTGSTGRLAIFLLVVAATVAASPWAAARLDAARAGDPPPVPRLGETVRLAGTAGRSPVEMTAEEVEAPGRAYVVRLTVRNDGGRPFAMGALEVGLTLDDLQPADAIGRPRAELAGAELQPGKERALTYRFTVPADRRPQVVVVVVGDRRADRASWQVS